MDVNFKLADYEDIEALVQLCNEVFLEDTKVEDAKKNFFYTQHNDNVFYLVGYVDDVLVAHAMITFVPTIFAQFGMYAILNHVCVSEKYRRHNIAMKMLDKIEQLCLEKGCSTIKLWSRNFRAPAHVCYQKFGFQKVDAQFFSKKIGKEFTSEVKNDKIRHE